MKTNSLLTVVLFLALAGSAQSLPPRLPPSTPPGGVPPPGLAPIKEPVNYLIRIEWKEPKGDLKFLELLTTEGNFELDSIQKSSVKINNNDIPGTLKFSGSLNALSDEQARLQLYLGRTVPYVTGAYGNGAMSSSAYSQLSVGLSSAFIVTFGKTVVIQNDESGQISVLVRRMKG